MTPHDLLVDAARLGVILAEFAALCLAIWLIEPFRRELIMRNWRREKFDAKSLQRFKEVVDAIPPQELPRAEKTARISSSPQTGCSPKRNVATARGPADE
jgi:hypothetical protein